MKTAIRLLDGLVAAGVAVDVTRRSKRRLFGPDDRDPDPDNPVNLLAAQK